MNRSVGIFDSGLGGLTVLAALKALLPNENILYRADTAHIPYGDKSPQEILQHTFHNTHLLQSQNIKLLIIACNTMAAVAYQAVKNLSPVPVLDVIDAGAREAISGTRTRTIGVIGTPATINSNAYARAIHRQDPNIRVFSQACPLFVPLVEEGWLNHPVTLLTAQEYLRPVLAEHIDTLVLGCTHYPLIKPLIREVAGPDIQLVDSAEAMAAITAQLLNETNSGNPARTPPEYRFYVTDVPYHFQTIGESFLGRTLSHVEVVKW